MHACGWVGVKTFMCVCLCVSLHVNLESSMNEGVCDSARVHLFPCMG